MKLTRWSKNMPAKRNPYAAALAHSIFRSKKVQPKKGKGSYNRKQMKLDK